MSVVYEIIIAVYLHKLISLLLNIVYIQISVVYSILYNQLAFCIKGIITCLHCSSVCVGVSRNKAIRKINGCVHCNLVSVVYEIIIAIRILNKLIS